MEFSKKIKKRREELNLTLEDVAKLVGVSAPTIQRYESGEIKNVRRDKIAKLAKALNLSPSYLMGWEDDSALNEEASEISNIAAHVDGDPLSEEEQEEVINFIKFIKSKRKDNNK